MLGIFSQKNNQGNYSVFGTKNSVSKTHNTVSKAIFNERDWKQKEKDADEYLKKLKHHIDDCDRKDFDSDIDYIVEFSRRTKLYFDTKEMFYFKHLRLINHLS